MRAAVCRQFGPARDITVSEVELPEPGPGQVRVRIEAAGANYPDALFVEGRYQIKPRLPFIPGGELAGTVDAVGEGVSSALLGRRVVGMSLLGAFAEAITLPDENCVVLPDSFDSPRAASFAESFCTAYFALHLRGGLQPGETVVVLGAGSGVGYAAVQLATSAGARVIAGASTPDKRSLARAAGAFEVFDPSATDVRELIRELVPSGVDMVVDPVGGERAERALRSLGAGGRYLVIGFAAGSIPKLPLNQILLRNRTVVGVEFGTWARSNPAGHRDMLKELVGMAATGSIDPASPKTYPLEQTGMALTDILERRVTGRVVIVP